MLLLLSPRNKFGLWRRLWLALAQGQKHLGLDRISDEALANRIEQVSTEEAMRTARRLAREEGIFAGTSTGANVAAALRVAAALDPGQVVVTIAIDSGMKYLSTPLYNRY